MEKEKPINNPDPSRPPFTYLPFQTPVSLEALLRPLLHHLRTPGIGPHEWKRITFDGRCRFTYNQVSLVDVRAFYAHHLITRFVDLSFRHGPYQVPGRAFEDGAIV
jgi:hypothetical protein